MAYEKLKEGIVMAIKDFIDQGYSQRQVAAELGVSPSTVSKYAPIKPPRKAAISKPDVEGLCEVLAPMLLEKLRATKPSDSEAEGEDRREESKKSKEKKMSDDDVQGKVQEALDRKEMLAKLAGIGQLTEKLNEALEIQKNETGETRARIDGLKEEFAKEIGTIKGSISDLCSKFPGLCSTIEQKITEIKNSKPKGVLGTDLKLNELMKDEKSQKVLAEKYLGPAGLVRALELCTGPECAEVRRIAKEKGINIQKKTEGGGMLGGGFQDIED